MGCLLVRQPIFDTVLNCVEKRLQPLGLQPLFFTRLLRGRRTAFSFGNPFS